MHGRNLRNQLSNGIDKNWVPHKLAIGKITNGLLSESSSIMVLSLGQKMSPGAIAPLNQDDAL
jgi:hypothetical protein